MSKPIVEIELRMDLVNGTDSFELVPAYHIEDSRYKIAASPGLAPGVAAGDEIELSQESKGGFTVLRRGGNICVQLFLADGTLGDRILLAEQIANRIKPIGGWIDGGMDTDIGHLLMLTIPLTSNFIPIEKVLASISNDFPVDQCCVVTFMIQ
jgi:hypothetical protein